ncbi:hypothetical protein [Microbaculum sp. FT89]
MTTSRNLHALNIGDLAKPRGFTNNESRGTAQLFIPENWMVWKFREALW